MRERWRDYRSVGGPVGAVIMGLGAAIGLCALAGFLFRTFDPVPNGRPAGGELALILACITTLIVGFVVNWYGRRHRSAQVTRREAILTVATIWFAAGVFGALPFVFGAGLSFTDAFFESVSGLTTTGATVITDIELRLSRPLLLWRSLLQWLGGMGIVVLFVAVFPNIGAGGKFMFGGEVPGTTTEGLRPRIAETSRELWKLYTFFTLLAVLVLYLLDVSLFEAVCHALTTLSTGGFSTRDGSIGAFDSPPVEAALAMFMLLGSVSYGLYYAALLGRNPRVFHRSVEFRAFVSIVLISVVVLSVGLIERHGTFFVSLRYAFFMVATTISSTGYGTDAYMEYPPAMLSVVVALMFVGGCAGSTAGGIKVERVVLMVKTAWTETRRSFRPQLVHVVRMGKGIVPPGALANVSVFVAVYFLFLAAGTAAIAAVEGVPLPAAFGAMLTCLSNMGPAPFHVDQDNFAAYSSLSKVLFVAAMLLGRLEFFSLLALVVPGFWRR